MTVKLMTLHCATGHDWTRPSQRGKPPRHCPEHSAPAKAPQRPVAARASQTHTDPYPVEEYPFIVYVDPSYVAPEPRDPEEIRRLDVIRANHRIDKLEARLRANGTHISQHQ